MQEIIEKDNASDFRDAPIHYEPSIRGFTLSVCSKKKKHIGEDGKIGYEIHFCPFCGDQFPKNLAVERAYIINTEFEHDDKCWVDDSCYPQEFQTDEWWKKRGL